MSLKIKIVLLVCLTFLGLSAAELGGSLLLLRHSERQAEAEAGRFGAERGRSAMAQLAAHLRALAYDYGTWDEACSFLDEPGQTFLDSNFPAGRALPPRVDFVAFLDPEYRTVYAVARDSRSGSDLPLPYDTKSPFPAPDLLRLALQNAEGADGLVRLPGGVAVAAAHMAQVEGVPGPMHGYVVFGLRVGRPLVDDLASMIGQRPSLTNWPAEGGLGDNPAARRELAGPPGVATVISGGDSLHTFIRLDDLAGQPAIVMRLGAERTVHRQAALAQSYFLVSMILATCIAGSLTLFLLRKVVFARLFRLESELNRIGAEGTAAARVGVHGDDELARLAEGVNGMLASLDQARLLIESARDEALSANRAKGDFLANMSHELRTPMNGVIGLANVLLQRRLPPAEQELVEGILVSAEHLLGLINDLLDLSKIAAGKLELHPAPFSLRALVEDVGRLHGLEAADRGLQLIVRVRPGSPDLLLGDVKRLRQILSNLLGNAVKYTERGRAVLEVAAGDAVLGDWSLVGRGSGGSGSAPVWPVEFVVRDTGVGIPVDRQEEIFSRFERGDPSVARRFGGTGLGLSICSQFVRHMGGLITVRSRSGRGTRFRVQLLLPMAPAVTGGAGSIDAGELSPPARLLVVARSAAARRALAEAAGDAGAEAIRAGSIDEARARLAANDSQGPRLDAILALHDPPRDDQAALTLAAEARPGTPAVIVAAASNRLRREAVPADGGRVFTLAAPVSRVRLRETLREIRHGRDRAPGAAFLAVPTAIPATAGAPSGFAPPASAGPSEPRAVWATPGPPRILVADDNQMNRHVAGLLLSDLGCVADFAVDGVEAAEKVLASRYDLVLMDWLMPRADGPEAVRRIRAREDRARRTPIVALSAFDVHSAEEQREAGDMDAFLAKPIDPAALRDVLRRFLGRVETCGLLVAAPTVAASTDPELIRLFLMEAPEQADALVGAVEAGSGPEIRRAAHALKTMCAILGQAHLTELCRELEFAGRDGALDRAGEVLPRFLEGLDALRQAIEDDEGEWQAA